MKGMPMTARAATYLRIEDLGDVLVIRFAGPKVHLNEENTPAIAGELFALADAFAGYAFQVDLDNVPFVSTPGLTMLLQFRKRVQAAAGQLRLANLQAQVAEVFRVTHLDSVFDLQTPECSTALT
jgi:anti-sigma B factor antagonist